MDFNTLANLRKYLTIKHHVPGRIRIKINPVVLAEPMAKELMQSKMSKPPGVDGVRFNALARSVVIEYDARRIAPDLLEDIVNAKDDAEAADKVRELDAVLRGVN